VETGRKRELERVGVGRQLVWHQAPSLWRGAPDRSAEGTKYPSGANSFGTRLLRRRQHFERSGVFLRQAMIGFKPRGIQAEA
jgi:hypothetical protein